MIHYSYTKYGICVVHIDVITLLYIQ